MKIKKLSLHEAQKIAAGEVVERPANALKELLENAIDAGSTKIIIYIKDGGKSLIRVVDNGCGMSPEDATLCFEQHATSKITSVDELTSLATFGFRGEALASIAAVSHISMITKEANADLGTQITLVAGTITQQDAIHANTGTDITIKEIFHNIPARKKFLKTRETEWHQIQQLFFAFCLAHIDIDFTLYNEDKLLYACCTVETLAQRIPQLFDQRLSQHHIKIHTTHKDITLQGFISNHQYERYDRNMIYLFVNKRWVKDATLVHAFIKGYRQVLAPGKFPAGCLLLSIPPQQVDINIHPRKQEVQFLNPRNAQQSITTSITQALEGNLSQQLQKHVSLAPNSNNQEQSIPPYMSLFSKQEAPFNPFNFDAFFQPLHSPTPSLAMAAPAEREISITIPIQKTLPFQHAHTHFQDTIEIQHYNIIGQYKKTYIMLEQDDGILMIDQHAAHERILYERLMNDHGNLNTITLLFPITLQMASEDIAIILAHTELFMEYGLEIEAFGLDTLKIQKTPLQLKDAPLEEIFKDALMCLGEHKEVDSTTFHDAFKKRMYASIACKAGVKAGDSLTHEHMKELIKDLYTTDHRFSCPHGRPTSWLLHHDEIEKKFKRDYRKNY